MCGICGILRLDGGAPDRRVLEQMTATLEHRGPDSQGVHASGAVGLGATRLAIIDLEHGVQPMLGADGESCVVQNGEIYNHRELRRALEQRGHAFRTASDTEVILRLYEDRGPSFVEELRGMFAIAIWDAPRRRLVLARDRFGIKPLFYRLSRESLSFASEIKALACQPEFSAAVDVDALNSYLSHNSIPAPLTIYREARKLPPGRVLVLEDGEVTIMSFARPTPAPVAELRGEPAGTLTDELRARLRDSVRAHLVSDVPVGVLLSGGIDSSALTALAAQESGERISTFSVGFAERSFNELENARLVATRYGTDHHELILKPDAAELLTEITSAFDEPFGDSSALPTYVVARMAAEHVKVVLSGEGADELFGGYETYAADLLAERGLGALSFALPLVERLPSSDRRVSLDYKAKRFLRAAHLPALERHHAWKEILSAELRAEVAMPAWRSSADPLAEHRARFAQTAGAPLLGRLQDVDLGIYLVDDLLVKTDRMTMAHSLEARVPFLDTAVAELAMALPTRLKVRGLAKKRLLREAVSAWVPERIVRGRKRGFSIPAAAWLRGELQPFAREVLSERALREQGFFDPHVVQRLLEAHLARREDNSRQLWGLISFALWAQSHRASGPGDAPAVAAVESA